MARLSAVMESVVWTLVVVTLALRLLKMLSNAN
jgi:hypothetical protein